MTSEEIELANGQILHTRYEEDGRVRYVEQYISDNYIITPCNLDESYLDIYRELQFYFI